MSSQVESFRALMHNEQQRVSIRDHVRKKRLTTQWHQTRRRLTHGSQEEGREEGGQEGRQEGDQEEEVVAFEFFV
jgi:hypothetical protein